MYQIILAFLKLIIFVYALVSEGCALVFARSGSSYAQLKKNTSILH